MPIFIAAIGGMLINIAGTLAGRVLIALGISVVTYTGMSTGLDWIKSQALSSFALLPPEMLSIVAYMKVGVCISIVSSAVAARLVLNGLTGGTFKKWVSK